MPFQLLPAIDLRAGRVVRLVRGDFDAQTIYDADPIETALAFVAAGARALHLVDLDAARTAEAVNGATLDAVVAAVGELALVEVAGGIRSLERAAQLAESGAGRMVVGTAALADTGFARSLVERLGPERVAVALDVRDGRAVGHGWTAETAGVDPFAALARLADVGVTTFEVTAIDRDGTFAGPDLALLERFVAAERGAIVASAGIASADDVRRCREIGCAGAIVGRALYEGRLTLAEALAASA